MRLIYSIFFLIGLGLIFGCESKQIKEQTSSNQDKIVKLEIQLKAFKELGFEFNEGATKEDILNMWGREKLESEPFSLLYISLGTTVEREPWTPITNQCCLFDTEAIEDNGAYIRIIENMKRISKGELDFKNIEDVVDWEQEKVSVSFELNGNKYDWDLEYNNDWVDANLFSRIVELTKSDNTNGKFTYYNTGGQDLVIGWSTDEELDKINKETGLDIVWLN